MLTKTFLCSFASPDLILSKIRFRYQAKRLKFYKDIKIFSKSDLSLKTKLIIKNKIDNNDRTGYGYWIWKPEIILNYIYQIPDNAILHYADIGCCFYPGKNKIKKFYYYQQIAEKNGFVAFQFKRPKTKKKNIEYPIIYEREYTKYDLAKYLGLKLKSNEMNSPQIVSGNFFIKKNNRNINFLKDWLKICNRLNLIDNSKSILKNHNNFKAHRNDQSAFSLLCKKYKIKTFSVYDDFENAYKNNKGYWGHLKNSVMQHRRDLKYISFYKFKKKVLNFFSKKYNKFNSEF
jgi:hypothetical protein